MPEIICNDCGKKMFHENEDTLKIEEAVHKKFCRKKPGASFSYMHRDPQHASTFDAEREADQKGKPVLK
ncbi:MAG: hypothetical protein AB1608_00210 [Thermoproteota archaeon]